MKQFRTYQLAKSLVHKCREVSVKMKAPYKDQFQRAALSIPLNLAEGSAKDSNADRKRFYEIAFGNLRELQALIDILQIEDLREDADVLGAHIYRLVHSLRHGQQAR
jgi:four helix bundle protein